MVQKQPRAWVGAVSGRVNWGTLTMLFELHDSSLLKRAQFFQPLGFKDWVMSPLTWKHQQSLATVQPDVYGTQWSCTWPLKGAVGKT